MKRKICSVLAAAIAIGTISMLSVSAASNPPGPAEWVYLKTDQYSQTSSGVNGTYKYIGGANSGSSKHTVVYKAQYAAPGKGFLDDLIKNVTPGSELPYPNGRTTVKTQSGIWRLELRPFGRVNRNCTANGWIYMKM